MSAGMAAGTFMGAAGGLLSAQAKATALNKQAAIQEQNAFEAEQQGYLDANKQQVTAARKIGSITAGYGASGVSANSGSVMDVLTASHINAELDRQNILHGAQLKKIHFENQASMDRMGANSETQAGFFSAMGGLLGMGGGAMGGSTFAGGGSGGSGTKIEDYGDAVD